MGDHDTARTRLRAALRGSDPWTALSVLHTGRPGPSDPSAPADTTERPVRAEQWAVAVEELYRSDDDRTAYGRHPTWFLGRLGDAGAEVLVRLVAEPAFSPAERRALLATAVGRGLRLPAAVLESYARQDTESGGGADGPPDPVLVNAMGLSGDLSFAPRLGALLDDPDAPRGRAALALGRLGARAWTVPIAERLSVETGLDHVAFAVALELMGDRAAVPHLLRWLAESREERVYDVHHALVRLTGRDPLLPEGAKGAEYAAAVRAAWADGRTGPAAPEVRDLVVESGARARFRVEEGAGRIRVAFDPPLPGSSWPRWDRSLTFDGRPLYRVGSVCDTCELGLSLLGWPDAEARRIAAGLRGRLADPHRLDAALLADLTPVLAELATGHYRALLLDLPLERVTDPARSWWHLRAQARPVADDDGCDEDARPEDAWPGVAHFQLPTPVPEARIPATYAAVLPSQPPEALDPAALARHAAALAAGERPAAMVLGWVDDRYVEARNEERWLVGVILDGHHRLTAYATAGLPARVLWITPIGEAPGADGGLEGLAELSAAYAVRE
ncbi:hypothetical protein AB0A60_20855 [Streptomyces sp. NPDC046275]|uniref:HEAT repeat domain-containing protein n=1 Tax=Streptomyces sp. NPDC046275 TaxID=3157201 RepID=UPI003410F509